VNDTATVTLSGDNTFTGGTTIVDGTVMIDTNSRWHRTVTLESGTLEPTPP